MAIHGPDDEVLIPDSQLRAPTVRFRPRRGHVILVRREIVLPVGVEITDDARKDLETFNCFAYVADKGKPRRDVNGAMDDCECEKGDLVIVTPSLLRPVPVSPQDVIWIAPFVAVIAVAEAVKPSTPNPKDGH